MPLEPILSPSAQERWPFLVRFVTAWQLLLLGSDAQRHAQIAHLISIYDCVYLKFIYVVFARASRCAPRRLAERDHRLLIELVLLGSIPDACQPEGQLFFTSIGELLF